MSAGGSAGRPWPLVGRGEELALVAERIEVGNARGVLLAGTAGSGKTRLAAEVRALAADRELPTLELIATHSTSDIPYAALTSVLRAHPERPELTLARGLEALENLAGDRRLVITVDDVNLLDRMSTALIHRAVVDGIAFLVATVRTDVPVPEPVIALWKDLAIERIEVQALSRDESIDMIRTGLGGELDAGAARMLWETSRGLPLYLRELALEGVASGALERRDEVWMAVAPLTAPPSLAELIELRMAELDQQARLAAEYLAITDRLEHELVTALTGRDAIAALEAAAVAVVTVDRRRRDVTLAHPLYGEVLRGGLTHEHRSRLASTVADHLERVGTRRSGDLLRVASWRLTAGDPLDPDVMAGAADEAYRAGDFDLAGRLAGHAGDAGSLRGSLLLGQILHERGHHAESEEIYRSLHTTDDPTARRLAIQRAVNLFFGLGEGEAALTALDRAPADPILGLNRIWIMLNMGRIDEAERLLAGCRPSDPTTERTAAVTEAWTTALAGRPTEAVRAVERAVSLAADITGPPSRFRDFPELPQCLALVESGRLIDAERLATDGLERSVDRHPMFIRAWWVFLLGRISMDRGRMRSAAGWFRQGAALQQRLAQPGMARWNLSGLALALAGTKGCGAEAAAVVIEIEAGDRSEESMFSALLDQAVAWATVTDGSTAPAVDRLLAAAERAATLGSRALERRLLYDVARLGRPDLVVDRIESSGCALDDARWLHIRALVDKDPGALSEAAETLGAAGAAVWAAEAWTAAARHHARTGDQRRANAARLAAEDALAECEEPDTPGLVMERSVTPLTDREREVLGLAARGVTSKEISENLFISVRTVNNLIQRGYVKLGVSSRSEAAEVLGLATE